MFKQSLADLRINRTQLACIVVLIVAVYGVVPQLGGFHGSIQALQHPQWGLVALAAALFLTTYAAAAATYLLLAFKPLQYGQTVRVQFAAMFVNRLLPAGIGALSANFLYLRRSKHTAPQAAAVLGVNNVLGFIGHGLVVAVALVAFPSARMLVRAPDLGVPQTTVLAIVCSVMIALMVGAWSGRNRLQKAIRDVAQQLTRYRQRTRRLAAALLSSVALTSSNIVCFYACSLAVGLDVTLLAAVLIFSLGIGLGTSTPTPGGIGGTEAGLLAGLLATGAPSTTALAAVLLYRLISYWLALGLGLVAFIDCQRRGLFTSP